MILDSKIPGGPLENKWTNYKSSVPLVSPANKRRIEVIVIGTGLAGASAAASMAEMGYKVKMVMVDNVSHAVDYPEDVEIVEKMLS